MTRNGARRALAPACAALLCGWSIALGSGCGSSSSTHLGVADAGALQRELAAVEASASQGDRAAALRRLEAIRTRLRRLAGSGALTAADADAMLRGVAQATVAASSALPASPPAATTAAQAPAPAAPAPGASTAASPTSTTPALGAPEEAPPGWRKHGRRGHDEHRHHGDGAWQPQSAEGEHGD
jgi:hypothetical protein